MTELRELAARYLGMRGAKVLDEVHNYYNKYCYPLVKQERKYRIQPSDDWCAAFVSVMMHRLGIDHFTPEVSVFYMVQNAMEVGRWASNSPKRFMPQSNDLVVYNWKNRVGLYNHVGIVYHVFHDGSFVAIEGNKGGEVSGRYVAVPHGQNSDVEGFIAMGTGFR